MPPVSNKHHTKHKNRQNAYIAGEKQGWWGPGGGRISPVTLTQLPSGVKLWHESRLGALGILGSFEPRSPIRA